MARPAPHSAFRTPHLKRLVRYLLKWFSRNARDLPWRRTRNPYAIWVSEIMLQQTQVKTVIPYWKRWMRELPTLEAVAKASPDKIHKLWEGLGYYTRARNLQKAAKQIVADCRRRGNESRNKIGNRKSEIGNQSEPPHVVSYKFPQKFEDVLALPGIGRYTAGAICSIAFNQPAPILDGNVIRVLTRIFGIAENPRKKATNQLLWQIAEELVGRAVPGPPRRGKDTAPCHSYLNQSLMELGALVCLPRSPRCGVCPAKRLCVAFRENQIEQLPNPGKRDAVTARHFAAFIVERNGHFLVRQRPAGVVNAHLWEFPNVEIFSNQSSSRHPSAHSFHKNGQSRLTSAATVSKLDSEIAMAAEQLGFKTYESKPLCTIKHSITRYRITLHAFRINFGGTSYTSPHLGPAESGSRITRPSEMGTWKTPAQLQRLAFSSAHKRILNQLTASR